MLFKFLFIFFYKSSFRFNILQRENITEIARGNWMISQTLMETIDFLNNRLYQREIFQKYTLVGFWVNYTKVS